MCSCVCCQHMLCCHAASHDVASVSSSQSIRLIQLLFTSQEVTFSSLTEYTYYCSIQLMWPRVATLADLFTDWLIHSLPFLLSCLCINLLTDISMLYVQLQAQHLPHAAAAAAAASLVPSIPMPPYPSSLTGSAGASVSGAASLLGLAAAAGAPSSLVAPSSSHFRAIKDEKGLSLTVFPSFLKPELSSD